MEYSEKFKELVNEFVKKIRISTTDQFELGSFPELEKFNVEGVVLHYRRLFLRGCYDKLYLVWREKDGGELLHKLVLSTEGLSFKSATIETDNYYVREGKIIFESNYGEIVVDMTEP